MDRVHGLLATTHNGEDARTFDLTYLGTGAAKVVFRIENVENCATISATASGLTLEGDLHETLRSKVLRLRKGGAEANVVEQNLKEYDLVLGALGLGVNDDHILAPILVRVHDDLGEKCNTILKGLEAAGHTKAGGVDAMEMFATLLKDLSGDQSYTLLELKLKWLAPSLSAPTDATCCRTCALNAMKMAARRTKAPNVLSCPLGHLVGDSSFRKQLMHELKLDGTTDFEKCSQWLQHLRK